MAAKTGKKVKGKSVSKAVKAFLKRKPAPAEKKPAAKIMPVTKKATAVKKTEPPRLTGGHAVSPVKVAMPEKPRSVAAQPRAAAPQQPDTGYISQMSNAAGPKYFFHSDVPDEYNDTYMRALPRDPEWIFVYWEISEAARGELKKKMGEEAYHSSKKLLRLSDVTGRTYDGSNAHGYTDVEINDYANNWYIRVPAPGRTYLVECGFLTAEGRFFLAVRSNTVNVPPFGLSANREDELAGTDELLRMSSTGLKRGLGSSGQRFGALAERGEINLGLSSGSGSGMFGAPSSK
ncbi:MAG TPA: DUF4912 domain-containing protein [Chitinivibrionales bacterium]|nr:DUF4912 domain-containing protein [Chitinivibrionales bacterium]